MSIFLYVDNSNLWIEGKRVSYAQNKNITIKKAIDQKNFDNDWRIDYAQLMRLLIGERESELIKADLFGSIPPNNEALWKELEKLGFDITKFHRNPSNKEKKIDTEMSVRITSDFYKNKKNDDNIEFIIVAGDSDYQPVISTLKEDKDNKIKCTIAFWEHAADELKNSADEFINLTKSFKYLTKR